MKNLMKNFEKIDLTNIPQNKVDPILDPALRTEKVEENLANEESVVAEKVEKHTENKKTKSKAKTIDTAEEKEAKPFYNYKIGFSFHEYEIIDNVAKKMSLEKGVRVTHTQAVNQMIAEQLSKHEKTMQKVGT